MQLAGGRSTAVTSATLMEGAGGDFQQVQVTETEETMYRNNVREGKNRIS